MTYTVHPGAERDLAQASDFYVKHAGDVVAHRFLTEFERVARLLVRTPDAGAEIRDGPALARRPPLAISALHQRGLAGQFGVHARCCAFPENASAANVKVSPSLTTASSCFL